MTENEQSSPSHLQIFFKKRWVRVVILLAVCSCLVLIALPFGIRWGAEYWLKNNGMVEVRIDDVDFNPFTGELRIYSLGASREPDQQLGSQTTDIRIDWMPFTQKHIWIESVVLHDAHINLERLADGTLIVGGLAFPPSKPDPTNQTPAEESKPWGFGVGVIDLQNVAVTYKQDDLNLDVLINQLQTDPIISWEPERRSNVHLNLVLNRGAIELDGEVLPFAQEPEGNLSLKIAHFPLGWLLPLVKEQGITILDGQIETNLAMNAKKLSEGFDFNAQGRFALEGGAITMPSLDLKGAGVSWQGKTTLNMLEQTGLKSSTNGDLSISAQSFLLPEQRYSGALASLNWNGAVNFDQLPGENGNTLTLAGTLRQKELQVNQGEKADQLLVLAGSEIQFPELTLKQKSGVTDIAFRTDLNISDLNLHNPEQTYEVAQKKILWTGSVTANVAKETAPAFSVTGDLLSNDLQVVDLKQKLRLAGWKSLNVVGQKFEGTDRISIAKVDLKDLQLLQEGAGKKEDDVARLQSLLIQDVSVQNLNTVKIGDIGLEGLAIKLLRNPNGEMDLSRWTAKSDAADEPKKESSEEKKSEPFNIEIGKLTINRDSRVVFVDQAVKPEYSQTLKDFTLDVGEINSKQTQLKTPIKLAGKLGSYGQLKCNGEIQPFLEKPNLSLEGELVAFELPPLTTYTARYLGYKLHSGQLDLHWKVPVVNGQIDSDNSLKLAKLDLETLKPDDEFELTQSLGLPINTALSLLRDGDDNIILDLPVSGNVDQPEFGTGSIIRKAVINAVKTGIISYYSPLGVVMGAGKLLSLATALRFDPVEFPAGGSDLTGQHKEYLDKMAQLLGNRPKVRLEICPLVVKSDVSYFQEQLMKAASKEGTPAKNDKPADKAAANATPQLPEVPRATLEDLAQQRARMVKDYLIGKGIGAERLFLCNPEIKREGDDKPQVKISI